MESWPSGGAAKKSKCTCHKHDDADFVLFKKKLPRMLCLLSNKNVDAQSDAIWHILLRLKDFALLFPLQQITEKLTD